MTEVRYPEVVVPLVGEDGNAFAIMGRVAQALRNHGVPQVEIDEYMAQSTSGNYGQLLQTVYDWVSVANWED